MKIAYLAAALFIFLPDVYAYIDPGTGSLILSSFWSYILGIFGIISGFVLLRVITPVKKWLKNEKK